MFGCDLIKNLQKLLLIFGGKLQENRRYQLDSRVSACGITRHESLNHAHYGLLVVFDAHLTQNLLYTLCRLQVSLS
jgi:hypothetical protein